jgi:hypothetical protein
MMAHGYERKKDCNKLMEEGRNMIQYDKKAHVATGFPNASENTTPPKEAFQKLRPSV